MSLTLEVAEGLGVAEEAGVGVGGGGGAEGAEERAEAAEAEEGEPADASRRPHRSDCARSRYMRRRSDAVGRLLPPPPPPHPRRRSRHRGGG